MADNTKNSKKGINDFSVFLENPFLNKLIVETKTKTNVIATKNGGAILNKSTGEIDEDTLFLAQRKQLDKEPFIKLFQSQLKALFGLTQAGVRVFGYFMEQSKFDDKVIFNWDECKDFTSYSSTSTIQKGMVELLENNFIAKTKNKNIYFINPEIFFKGDRIVLVTEYRKKKKPKKNELNPNQLSLLDAIKDEEE